MEVVGEHDLGHDHRPDADHDQAPGQRQPPHPAVGGELAIAVHAAADLFVPIGMERCADADHEQGRDGHHRGRGDEHPRRRGDGQERPADPGAEHVAGALERSRGAVRAGELVVADEVRHRPLDGRRERALGAAGGDHEHDRGDHVAVPDEQRGRGKPERRQQRRDEDDDAPVVAVADMAGPRRDEGGGAEDREHRAGEPPGRSGARVERPDQRREGRAAAGIRQPLAGCQAQNGGIRGRRELRFHVAIGGGPVFATRGGPRVRDEIRVDAA